MILDPPYAEKHGITSEKTVSDIILPFFSNSNLDKTVNNIMCS
jgi:hypothetical protein